MLDSILSVLTPIHREGYRFIAAFAIAALLLLLLWPPLGWLCVIATLWCAYFFRDPQRVTPQRPGLVISPADGRVSAIEEVRPPRELDLGEEPRLRVSVFMNVFDVHVNRAPVAGRVTRIAYTPGKFINALNEKCSEENEQVTIWLENDEGVFGIRQIAGAIARRIVCDVKAARPTTRRFRPS